jgi:hypothetical protein
MDGSYYPPSAHAVVAFEAVAPKDLLTWKCEILISASAENVITRRNADRIQARIIAEGANGPITDVADEILADTARSICLRTPRSSMSCQQPPLLPRTVQPSARCGWLREDTACYSSRSA